MSNESQIDLIIAVKAQTEQLQKLIGEVSKLTGNIAASGKESEKAGSSFEKFIATAADIAVTGKGIKEVAGFLKELAVNAFEMVKDISDADIQLTNLSNSTGASKEALKALSNEAEKLGKDIGEVKGAASQFQGFINDALKDPLGEAAQAAGFLGINLKEVSKSSNGFDLALRQVSASTNGAISGFQQGAAAAKAFGEDSYSFIIPALKDIDSKIGDVQKRGQILTPEQSKRAKELGNSLGDLKSILEGLTTTVLADTIPAINDLVTIGKDELQALLGDPEFLNGLKSGLESLSVLIKNFGADLIAVAGKVVSLLGRVGETVSAVLSPFETLNFLITGNAVQTEKSAEANEKFDSAVKSASESVIALTAQIKKLTEEQSINQKAAEINSQKQLFIINEQLRLGIIGQEEAAKRRAEIDSRDLERKAGDAFKQLSIVRDTIAKQLGEQENAIKVAEKLEQDSNSKRKTLLDQFEKDRIASDRRIADATNELAQKKADRQKELNDTELSERKNRSSEIAALNKADEASLQELIEKERQNIETKRSIIEILRTNEKQASSERASAEQALADLKTAINKKELEEGTSLSKELLDLRKKLFDAETSYSQLTLQQTQQRVKQIIDLEKGILADRDKALEKLESNEKDTTAALQQELSEREINRQQFEEKKLDLVIGSLSKEIDENEKALQKLQSLEGASADQIKSIKQKLSDDRIKLSELESDQRITLAEKATSAEKALEERRNGETKRGIEDILNKVRQGDADQETSIRKILNLELDANRQKLIAKQSELDLARQTGASDEEQARLKNELLDIQRLITKEEKALKGEANDVADAIRSQVSAAADAGKAIGDITNQTAQGVKQLYGESSALAQQFHDTGSQLFSSIQSQNTAALTNLANAQAAAAQEYARIVAQEVAAIKAAYRDAEESRVDANESANAQIEEAARTRDEALRNLARDFVKFKRETERQIAENIFEGLQLIAEENSRYEQNRTRIAEEESDRRKEVAAREAEEVFDLLQSYREQLASEQERADDDAYEKRRSFTNRIIDLEKELGEAKTQTERDAIQKQIDLANAAEQQRLDRERRKKEALDALDKEFQEKTKGVTDPATLKKLEEEFKARKSNVDKKFDLEEQFQEDYNNAIANGNKERAEELKRDYEQQLKDQDGFLQTKIDNIEANYKHEQELATAQRAAEEAAYQEKLATEKTRHDNDIATIIQRETEKNEKLQDALDDERKRRKNQREKIEEAYTASEKRIREEQQKTLDLINQKLGEALDAAVGKFKSFSDGAGGFIDKLNQKISDLISKYQQLNTAQGGTNGAFAGFPGTGSNLTTASNLSGFGNTNNITSTSTQPGAPNQSDKNKPGKLGSGSGLSGGVTPGGGENDKGSPIIVVDNGTGAGSQGQQTNITINDDNTGIVPFKKKKPGPFKPAPNPTFPGGAGTGESEDGSGVIVADVGGVGASDAGSAGQQTNVTTASDQADDAKSTGKKGVKIKPQNNRPVERGKIKGEKKGGAFQPGDSDDDDITAQDTGTIDEDFDNDDSPVPGGSGGKGQGKGKGDVIVQIGNVVVSPNVSASATITAITGVNKKEFLDELFEGMVQAVRSRGGPEYKVFLEYKSQILEQFGRDLERRGAFS